MRESGTTEPLIYCPKCNTSIKLTELLAAPLIAKTRKQIKHQLAEKEREFAKREVVLRDSQKTIAQARRTMDAEIAERLRTERTAIIESETAKARLALKTEMEQRDTLLSQLQNNLKTNNAKLAEAQQAHAEVIRKNFVNWTMPSASLISPSKRKCKNRLLLFVTRQQPKLKTD